MSTSCKATVRPVSAAGRKFRIECVFAITIIAFFTSQGLVASEIGSTKAMLIGKLQLDGTLLDLRGTGVGDEALAALSEPPFRKVTRLLLARTAITDIGLDSLTNLPLEHLDLYRTAVSGPGLETLRGLPLRYLDLSGTRVSDEALVNLRGMPLERLILSDTGVTDKGLTVLSDLPLRVLDLSHTGVVGNDFDLLANFKTLTELNLRGTRLLPQAKVGLSRLPYGVTVHLADSGLGRTQIEELKQKRPDLRLIVQQRTR